MKQSNRSRRLTALLLSALLCLGISACGFLQESTAPSASAYAAATTAQSALQKPVITVKASGAEILKISWSKVSGAKKYEVYRSASKSGEYKKVGTTSNLSYSDKKIDQNKTYYYKVRAVSGNAKSAYSGVKSSKINTEISLKSIPPYSGSPYVDLKKGIPSFSARMKSAAKESYETYSKLDSLKRPGMAVASVGRDLMPEGERGSIGMVKPAGFSTVRYDDLIADKYLYNRCHLIGWQLTGENANEKNLITGTRYMNVEGMLPFENQIAAYVKSTGNHVLYRVTPIYSGDELVCRGVQMEAWSVEDRGKGLSFHVFVYNVQPGIEIDYATGGSQRASGGSSGGGGSSFGSGSSDVIAVPDKSQTSDADIPQAAYVLNKNTKKFHYASCSSVSDMAEHNKIYSSDDRSTIIGQGYVPCKRCNP